MTLSQLQTLIPVLKTNGVRFFKTKDIELLFQDASPNTVTVTTKDGKTVTATQIEKPIETVKSVDAQIPTDNLEQEKGLTFDQILNWSSGTDDFPVPGTNDSPINDTPIEDPKINGVASA